MTPRGWSHTARELAPAVHSVGAAHSTPPDAPFAIERRRLCERLTATAKALFILECPAVNDAAQAAGEDVVDALKALYDRTVVAAEELITEIGRCEIDESSKRPRRGWRPRRDSGAAPRVRR